MAFAGQWLIGTVALLDLGQATAKLKRLFVLPTYHGQGVGSALLNHALAHAKQQNFSRMILNTYPTMKRAQSFYLKHGFTQTHIVCNKIGYELILISN